MQKRFPFCGRAHVPVCEMLWVFTTQICNFIMAADTALWYNNLKVAACAAARVQGTRPCANAQGFENIEPCKTAARAVLLGPLRGVMV
ncbi:hypothetical protein DW194_08455 [Subdoligranulum sp. AM16-9]|uniref:Uncharacterized protein n=1 Tax=Ruthenibacterium lactatiformans TaxID=1550024 RepID=A0A0D8IXU0_9FIRM|nr:hypothetical protein TQ39_12200 [Ruthenibacterium lactatiformans]RGC98872.1 hypothetical protein DW194_08455 [Subdoligranulum sp. AM16-9]